MKIVNVTLVVTTDESGQSTETPAVDPNFRVGLSYPIPEIGDGLWTVTAVSEPTTNLVGGKTIATTRVTVERAAPDAEAAPVAESGSKGAGHFKSKSTVRPIPKAGQKARHTPR